MRFVAVDWGTSRFRALLVDGDQVLARAESEDGVSQLAAGQHAAVFARHCNAWLAAEPGLPVIMAGMVGSREGWAPAPYLACPAGADDVAAALLAVDLGGGRQGFIVPGLTCEPIAGGADVMRGEETHLLGSGVADGLVCLPGTHCKWVLMQEGRIARFATFMTGEIYALMRNHSMVGRPATEPADQAGFARGLEAAGGHNPGLLHLLFGARAAVLTGRLESAALGPYLSGLITGEEVQGALSLFGPTRRVTVIADRPRADLYVEALARHGIETAVQGQEATLLAGLLRILASPSRR